ncbi:hypothetical protein GMA11_07545 [Granulicatella sp. zg-ZJ]|uniref:hypothetical protein n=1 Tax=Granulicatella sp. zg-ZJ TaxID=2678504 RepID=UPI0013CFFEDD|nr:hypothetical protein [Granulicatella sp. zg-ZJ]NEW63247.1 hypothetical protein [Granulicatella sp. zg-ZJ]
MAKKTKRKAHKKISPIQIIVTVGLLSIIPIAIILFFTLVNDASRNNQVNKLENGALSRQVMTTQSQQTKGTYVTTQTRQETTQQTTEKTSETTEAKKEKSTAHRLDDLGNSGLEFDTLDEAYSYGADVLNNPEKLKMLQDKKYSGYQVMSVRWSDGAITYTIEWK